MTELMLEILAYLGVAALLGLILGYLFWGWGQKGRIAAARAEGAAGARTSVDGNPAMRQQLDACHEEREKLEEQVEDLQAELRALRKRGEQSAPAGLFAKPGAPESEPQVEPVMTPAVQAEDGTDEAVAPEAPATLLTERPDEVDDLKQIKGVGKVMEGVLNAKGIYLFRQVANFSDGDVAWVNEAIEAFPGRIRRDRWVEQAQDLYRTKYGRGHADPET